MNSVVRNLVPKWMKRPVKETLLRHQLRGAIRSINKLPLGQVPDRALLSNLMRGWGNEGFAANLEYLEAVAEHSVQTCGPVLECGSGATTILLGLLCARRNIPVWSLEHYPEWRGRVSKVIGRNKIRGVHLCSAPLVEYGEFVWYDPPEEQLPKEFSLVVCDGPPGATRGGRYGLLPVIGNRLPIGSKILLDDAGRPGEAELIKRWEEEAGFETAVFKSDGRDFAVMKRTS
jgi:hypothetical protein